MKSLSYILIFILFFLFAACEQKKPELVGLHEAYKIEIQQKNVINESIRIKDFGFASVNVEPDSATELNLQILKDVRVRKQILGTEQKITLIRAKYSRMQQGVLHHTGHKVYAFNSGRRDSVAVKIYFAAGDMIVEFTDSDSITYKLFF